ncbi:MAG: PAS domain-containing sensor histidine kinase [Planctomycetota bacterium]|jgi:PAS domain S-box-containing protein
MASQANPEGSLPGLPAGTTEVYTRGDGLHLLFEQNLAGVYRTTLDGRILDCNKSFAAILGYASPRELCDLPASRLYFDDGDRSSFVSELCRRSKLTNFELRLRRSDGTAAYILENVHLVANDKHTGPYIQGTMVDITDRKLAEHALRQSEEKSRSLAQQLRRLTQHLQHVREQEQARIARELHDELGQSLTVLKMDLHWLEHQLEDNANVALRVHEMLKVAGATIDSVHGICANLRPSILEDFGLCAAIEWQVDQFKNHTGIGCDLSLPDGNVTLSTAQATSLFRIAQESLTNVARHARATRASVSMSWVDEEIVLIVEDDGVGIPPKTETNSDSLGLVGMRERALQWDGTLTLADRAGGGTRVALRMPRHIADKELER